MRVFVSLLLMQQVAAQYKVHFIVTVPSDTDNVYIAGTFNEWNPKNENYKLVPAGKQQKEITIHHLQSGKSEFKFTRGIWSSEEVNITGQNIENHLLYLIKDTTLYFNIHRWSDSYIDVSYLSDSMLFLTLLSRANYYLERNNDSCYKYAMRLYDFAQKLHSKDAAYHSLNMRGLVFARQGNREKALKMFFEALEIKQHLTDRTDIAGVYQNIASIYEEEGEFVKAKEMYLQALQYSGNDSSFYIAYPLANTARCYYNLGRTDSAKYYLQTALKIDAYHSPAFMLMGDILLKSGNNQPALDYYRKALFTAHYHSNNINTVSDACRHIAIVLQSLHKEDSAFYYAEKSFAYAKGVKNPYTIISSGSLLVDFFKNKQKYDSAFFYQDIVLKAKDSLFTQEKERQIHNIYFNEQLRQQELQAQKEKFQSRIQIYILIGVLIVGAILGVSYRARLKSKFYKQLSEIEMRALRAQMNPHFIFNCLASINRYIVKSDTKTASGYLTKFSKLIRLILDNSANEYIALDVEIQTLKLYLDMELLRFDHSFDYKIEQDELMAADSIMIPTMVIQPYIENAIWHGLLHRDEKGKLWVRFKKVTEDVLQVEIEDDGIGRKKAAELRSKDMLKTKSYGMKISQERIQIINTRHHIQSSVAIEDLYDEEGVATGTRVIVHLPLIEQSINLNVLAT